MTPPIPLAHHRTGAGAPLVLIHGFPLDHTVWNETVPLLQDRFDLVLPDLRGFGRSPTVESPYTLRDMAGDIAALLDELGIQKAHLAGHSMGGYVALAFAKAYPERLLGLALVASQAAGDSAERKQGRYRTAAEVEEKGRHVVVDAMAAKFTPDPRVQDIAREIMSRQTVPAISGALKAMAEREDLEGFLASSDFPLVLIHGDADELVPVDQARRILGVSGTAELVELPGAGHMPMLEFPAETAEAIGRLG